MRSAVLIFLLALGSFGSAEAQRKSELHLQDVDSKEFFTEFSYLANTAEVFQNSSVFTDLSDDILIGTWNSKYVIYKEDVMSWEEPILPNILKSDAGMYTYSLIMTNRVPTHLSIDFVNSKTIYVHERMACKIFHEYSDVMLCEWKNGVFEVFFRFLYLS
jgi:hypothetical protein